MLPVDATIASGSSSAEEAKDALPVIRLIAQGAEARVYESVFLGKPAVVKERFRKLYRHPVLEEKLRTKRLAQEARCLTKCRALGVDTPVLWFVDELGGRLIMEKVPGVTVKHRLFASTDAAADLAIAVKIGAAIAKLHSAGYVHGDLTTSNMMLREGTDHIVMLDFGLAAQKVTPEVKAVDLYVLERAFIKIHLNAVGQFDAIVKSYAATAIGAAEVVARLEKVRARGRKKLAFG